MILSARKGADKIRLTAFPKPLQFPSPILKGLKARKMIARGEASLRAKPRGKPHENFRSPVRAKQFLLWNRLTSSTKSSLSPDPCLIATPAARLHSQRDLSPSPPAPPACLPPLLRNSLPAQAGGGKSELHRARCRVTPVVRPGIYSGGGLKSLSTESATEN